MIKRANSTQYHHSKSPIVNLKSAFMVMGLQGLLTSVVYVFINNFRPSHHISKVLVIEFDNTVYKQL
ncbi:hypothetical protein [Colwellia sp. MB02u-14]